ncbi:MAG: hypothetical protein A49_23530 [Methyloceanibacter sp.]|nr:MAG: hypothetical protein A49_23530 [Methyloceanibacter sp.]
MGGAPAFVPAASSAWVAGIASPETSRFKIKPAARTAIAASAATPIRRNRRERRGKLGGLAMADTGSVRLFAAPLRGVSSGERSCRLSTVSPFLRLAAGA